MWTREAPGVYYNSNGMRVEKVKVDLLNGKTNMFWAAYDLDNQRCSPYRKYLATAKADADYYSR